MAVEYAVDAKRNSWMHMQIIDNQVSVFHVMPSSWRSYNASIKPLKNKLRLRTKLNALSKCHRVVLFRMQSEE